jgi:hypothetical protein
LHPTDDDDDDLPGWTLLEQRLAPVRLGDDDIDPARTHLSLPRQRLGVLSTVSLDDFARQWLRQRGFSPDGSTLHAYESIVEPGAAATLARSDDGATLTVAASTALTRT